MKKPKKVQQALLDLATKRYQEAMAQLEQLKLQAHQEYDAACLVVRDAMKLDETYAYNPDEKAFVKKDEDHADRK